MDKPEVEHLSHDEKSDGSRVVDKFPPEARAEAGVLLEVEGAEGTSLRLAEDGHVSFVNREIAIITNSCVSTRPYFCLSRPTIPTTP